MRERAKLIDQLVYEDEYYLNTWQFQVETAFRNMTRVIPDNEPVGEKLFVGFSFKRIEDIKAIRKFINEDFMDVDSKPYLGVNIVDLSDSKNSLYTTLMDNLKISTMGLFFLTEDIQQHVSDTYHGRPNVYFELGYMLSHLRRYESPSIKRIGIFVEEKVQVPSDLQDIFRTQFPKDLNIHILYYYILEHLLRNVKTLSKIIAEKIINNYINRLEQVIQKKEINESDINIILTYGANNRISLEPMKAVLEKLEEVLEKRFPATSS